MIGSIANQWTPRAAREAPQAPFEFRIAVAMKITSPVALIKASYRLDGRDADWLKELASSHCSARRGARHFAFLHGASSGDWTRIHGVDQYNFPIAFTQQLFNQPYPFTGAHEGERSNAGKPSTSRDSRT